MILAFDVRVERDAQEMADSLGVKIFVADIIYHLFDNFLKHRAVGGHPELYYMRGKFREEMKRKEGKKGGREEERRERN